MIDSRTPLATEPQADPFLTTNEVAARYRTAPGTVRYWRHAGTGPRSFKVGKRVLYRESELIRWEQERDAEQNGTGQ
ncbi:helix-turn-helix transcriptional regulator [Actinomadura craniellae]|uniref:helix-turn-helix transcriptional regulator n=1 Tax=Actinomadura craniellae TaxID=2231787 RepID=UPI001F182FBE|nr:helix-turn-helix domain-containing protein [Actinomadura craniellae]